ncbi:MAG: recombinase family protein [Candidatus Omnitrophica bacterium]|nr:recombinase family protein [Candidatus Omnitrophota bacterium]
MRVALYTRVSTEDQAREGFSLEVQQTYLLQYAKNFGWDIFCSMSGRDVYMDDGYSGGNMDRPAMQRLLFDARSKRFDMVLVYKQDRLSRKLKDLLALLEEFESLGIGYKSATEPFDTTSSAGKMAIQMLGSCAEFERNRLVERVFPGMVVGVKRGHWQGARYAPYGYRYNKEAKKFEVHQEEAKIVKEIFAMYIGGKSTSQIAGYYYNLGIASRQGGKFYTKFISSILKNKAYLGTLVWNKRRYDTKEKTRNGEGKGYKYVNNDPSKIIEVPNCHEAIITQEEFDRAQKLLKRNRTNTVVRFKNNVYHLSGVLKCNECGMNYRGLTLTVNHRTKARRPWYCCSSKGVSYIKCENKSVTADAINKQVWDIIDTISKNLHVIEELGDMIKLSATEPEQHYIEELETKEKALSKNLEKQKALYEVFSEDKINIDIYKDRAELLRNEEKKLRQDVKAIQLKILEKRNSINLVKATQDFLLRLRSNPNSEQMDYLIKTFMRIIFKAIYIQNQEIVKVDINQPWKMCYDEALKKGLDSRFRGNDNIGKEGVKCQTKREMTPKKAKKSTEETEPKAKVPRRESVYFCVPSAVR